MSILMVNQLNFKQGKRMKDKASKLQKLANDYEVLANLASNSGHSSLKAEGERLLGKSKEYAQQAKTEAFREALEDRVS